VVESRVDHAIRRGHAATQAIQVFKITSMYLSTGRDKRFGACI
jgi:hypothetical protein